MLSIFEIFRERRTYQKIIRNVKNFWNSFKRNRKGIIGLAILLFFLAIAILAPILAPHDPLNDYYVAGHRAAPEWVAPFLGSYSLNMFPIKDPKFSSENALNEWDISLPHGSLFEISSSYSKITISPEIQKILALPKEQNVLGSIHINLKKTAKESFLLKTINISKTFNYEYSAPPKKFICNFMALKKGSEDIYVTINYFIITPKYGKVILLSKRLSENSWLIQNVDSHSSDVKRNVGKLVGDPTGILTEVPPTLFTSKGTYTFGIQIDLYDESKNESNVDIYLTNMNIKLLGSAYGILGTDHFGRDLYSQLLHGSRTTLYIAFLCAFISVSIGLIVGLVSGYVGGLTDEISMRFTDVLLTLPYLPLVLVLMAVLGAKIENLIILLGFLGWMGFARMVRSQTLSLKERAFVEASRALGASTGHIIFKHILPNVMGLVYVALALNVPTIIVAEAWLSFLGLGDPNRVTWGKMIFEAEINHALTEFNWILPPGICIGLISLSFVLIGYSLDEILNPRLRKR